MRPTITRVCSKTSAPHQHEPQRQSLRQRRLRILYEDVKMTFTKIPRPGRGQIVHRAVHRENLQRQASSLGPRLPAAGRVRTFASDSSSFNRSAAGDRMTAIRKMRAPSGCVFKAWLILLVRCVITSFYPRALPAFRSAGAGYRTRRKERVLPIVRDEFRPAIPQRAVASAALTGSPAYQEGYCPNEGNDLPSNGNFFLKSLNWLSHAKGVVWPWYDTAT